MNWPSARCCAVALMMGLGLAGCATPPTPGPVGAEIVAAPALPPMAQFRNQKAAPPLRSNEAMAQDFLDLFFQLESGRQLPVFTRFETPLTYTVSGSPTPVLRDELDRLLLRLKREAGLSLTPARDGAAAITIEAIKAADLERVFPQAACFVLPLRTNWQKFRRTPRSAGYDWTQLRTRRAITVFIPADTSPQDIRDCLHEEVAQGLGPLNDLYRLPDSVFNDDNFHAVLTGFDMLMLRATYHRDLRSGMTREQVAARLPRILAELNPRGKTVREAPSAPSSAEWIAEITATLSPGRPASRLLAAARAVALADAAGWQDNRTGLSHFMLGRLRMGKDDAAALRALMQAGAIFNRRAETRIQSAHVGFHVALFALGSGQWEAAITLADRYAPVAERHENAALLSDLLLVKATALQVQGRDDRSSRTEALAFGLRAWGNVARIRAREAEIAALALQPRT